MSLRVVPSDTPFQLTSESQELLLGRPKRLKPKLLSGEPHLPLQLADLTGPPTPNYHTPPALTADGVIMRRRTAQSSTLLKESRTRPRLAQQHLLRRGNSLVLDLLHHPARIDKCDSRTTAEAEAEEEAEDLIPAIPATSQQTRCSSWQ